MTKYKVTNYNQTCCACPSQWDIQIHDNEEDNNEEYIYARYRWGWLTVTLYNEDHPWGTGGKTLVNKSVGSDMDGCMTTDELIKHTRHILDWGWYDIAGSDNDSDDYEDALDRDYTGYKTPLSGVSQNAWEHAQSIWEELSEDNKEWVKQCYKSLREDVKEHNRRAGSSYIMGYSLCRMFGENHFIDDGEKTLCQLWTGK